MNPSNLLGPAPVELPVDPAAAELAAGEPADQVVRRYPASCLSWAVLAEQALDSGDDVAAYAYARVGYHRGLDLLRRNGWKGAGPIPWAYEPNRGFLSCLALLSRAAGAIGEDEERDRCRQFLLDCDPAAAQALGQP